MRGSEPNPKLLSPGVSIVVCNFNYGRFLEAAVSSALRQSYPCQVVVVDDGSTDNSRDKLSQYSDRIELVLQENGGQRAAYNAGFLRCTGDIVLFLDSDDWLEPTAAERVAQSFGKDISKVHFRLALVDEAGDPLGPSIPTRLSNGDVVQRLTEHGLLYASAPGSGNAYRRSVLVRLFPLPIDPIDRHAADFFTVYGAPAFGEVRSITEVLGNYRVHAASDSNSFEFGNAVQSFDEFARFQWRVRQFRAWLEERSGKRVVIPEELYDFSQLKTRLANEVFSAPYWIGLSNGLALLPKTWRSIWLDRDFSLLQRVPLSIWALAVVFAPRPLVRTLARVVTNPSARTRPFRKGKR